MENESSEEVVRLRWKDGEPGHWEAVPPEEWRDEVWIRDGEVSIHPTIAPALRTGSHGVG